MSAHGPSGAWNAGICALDRVMESERNASGKVRVVGHLEFFMREKRVRYRSSAGKDAAGPKGQTALANQTIGIGRSLPIVRPPHPKHVRARGGVLPRPSRASGSAKLGRRGTTRLCPGPLSGQKTCAEFTPRNSAPMGRRWLQQFLAFTRYWVSSSRCLKRFDPLVQRAGPQGPSVTALMDDAMLKEPPWHCDSH